MRRIAYATKSSILTLLMFALLIILGSVALAAGGDPQILFTDNIEATGTSIAVTEMEQ